MSLVVSHRRPARSERHQGLRRLHRGSKVEHVSDGIQAVLFACALSLLAALWREGPPYELSPGGLLASVTISSGGMTGRIDRLERAGLVARRPDPDDRRGVLVRLTDAGAQLTGELINSYLTEQKRFVSVLTPGELERLERLLRKLTTAAERSAPDGRRSRHTRRR